MSSSVALSHTIRENGHHPTITGLILNWDSSYNVNAKCSLHLLFSFPPILFVDPYELQTSYADKYAFHLIGHRGLELPVMAVENQENHLLLDVKAIQDDKAQLEMPVPIHFRYGELSSSHAYENVKIPAPKGFLACSSVEQRTAPSFDYKVLPSAFQSLFSNRTSLVAIFQDEIPGSTLQVPVGNPLHITHVEIGTSFTVFACFLYLGWLSWRTKFRLDYQEREQKLLLKKVN